MATYKVPVTITTVMTVEANNRYDAEYQACQAAIVHFPAAGSTAEATGTPATLGLYAVSCTVFIRAYSSDQAQEIVDDTFNAGCRATKQIDDTVITSFDIDSVSKAE